MKRRRSASATWGLLVTHAMRSGSKAMRWRLMVLVCHNTDLGDGWEREGENKGYFEAISAKWAYPLGINIVVYAMTH